MSEIFSFRAPLPIKISGYASELTVYFTASTVIIEGQQEVFVSGIGSLDFLLLIFLFYLSLFIYLFIKSS